MDIVLQNKSDDDDIEALLDKAFGEARFNKAAYRLRAGVSALSDLSFIIRKKDVLIASLRFWPVEVAGNDALLLGPIAVLPALQGQGYGIRLMRHGLEAAKSFSHKRVVLVGDEPYYSRVGFNRKCAENITMHGQKDESRILALELDAGAFDGVSGVISKTAK